MLASELAQSMSMDPTLVSRRLNMIYQEIGRERGRFLDNDAVDAFRKATDVLKAGQAKTFRDAVRSVLGKHVSGISADSVQQVIDRLDALQAQQAVILQTLQELMSRSGDSDDTRPEPVAESPSVRYDTPPLWGDDDDDSAGQSR